MADDIAIKVEHVSKNFVLPHEKVTSVKRAFTGMFSRDRTKEVQHVLKDISFEIKKGEFFGIVGRNGSGKSTMLKILSSIYQPTSGKVHTNGTLVPFIELGVGFNPELTGRENVYLNGAMLGFSQKEIDVMYDDIVEFAELERFMDQKLKNYSSGMQVRLAFSVAIRAESDILVLDEVLAVGDEAFQRKCDTYFKTIKGDKAKTVILVTHNMEAMKRFCNRALLIQNGEIVASGSPEDVANEYTQENFETKQSKKQNDEYATGLSRQIPHLKVVPESKQTLTAGDELSFRIEYEITDDTPVRVSFRISDETSSMLLFTDVSKVMSGRGVHYVGYSFPVHMYNNIPLNVRATIEDAYSEQPLAFTSEQDTCYFTISNKGNRHRGLLKPDKQITGEWHEL